MTSRKPVVNNATSQQLSPADNAMTSQIYNDNVTEDGDFSLGAIEIDAYDERLPAQRQPLRKGRTNKGRRLDSKKNGNDHVTVVPNGEGDNNWEKTSNNEDNDDSENEQTEWNERGKYTCIAYSMLKFKQHFNSNYFI